MPKKRNNYDGSVYEDKDRGGYRAQIRLPEGKRITKRFKDPEEAVAWKNDQLAKLGRGQLVRPNEMTLGKWIAEYLRIYSQQDVRQRTFERYVSLAKHCKPIAHLKLQQLQPNHFQELYLSMEKYSGETKKKVHNLLHMALDQAVNNKFIYSNPIDSVKPPKVIREEITTFTPEELQCVLSTAKRHRLYPTALLAATTGMRLSEVLGLRWQDVNFTEEYVRITWTLHQTSTGIIFEPPKSKASRRKISIPKETVNVLKETKQSQLQDGKIQTLCFVSLNQTPIQPRNFERWWGEVQCAANPSWVNLNAKRKILLKEKISKEDLRYKNIVAQLSDAKKSAHKKFHSLRHTHATLLLAAGVPIIEVSRRLGHAKPSITLDLYGHAIPGQDKQIAAKITDIYGI